MPDILMGTGTAGLKGPGTPDILIVLLPYTCNASLLTTDNYFRSGSVIYSKEAITKTGGKVRALFVNSGNANCGLKESFEHASLIAESISTILNIKKEEVLVFSTGVIGKRLPINSVLKGIEEACSKFKAISLEEASRVIGTTDRFEKIATSKKGKLEVFGFAKGAGMIAPSMATMLSFVFTNVSLDPYDIHEMHKNINDITFNSITVDGCQSTNDCSLLVSLDELVSDQESIYENLLNVYKELAKKILEDGEGSTKIVSITVKGATLQMKAREIAKTIANSLLVKTAIFGRDPNWGRIAAAAGSTEFPIDQNTMKIYIGDYIIYDGAPNPEVENMVKNYLEKEKEVEIVVDLSEGESSWTYYTCDLGYEYIKLNAEYRT